MAKIIDIKTRKEYKPNLVESAGKKAGQEFRGFIQYRPSVEESEIKAQKYRDFIKEIDEQQARIDTELTELEDMLRSKGIMVPGPQLRLL